MMSKLKFEPTAFAKGPSLTGLTSGFTGPSIDAWTDRGCGMDSARAIRICLQHSPSVLLCRSYPQLSSRCALGSPICT